MTRKRKRLVIGDRIMMLAPPRKRGPVRIDRRVPSTWEEFEQLRDERRREAERSALFEAMRAAAISKHDASVDTDHDVEHAVGDNDATESA